MTNQVNNQSVTPSTDEIQLTLTLKMTITQVFETSVTVNNNSPIQDCYAHLIIYMLICAIPNNKYYYVHPDDQTQPTFELTLRVTLRIY